MGYLIYDRIKEICKEKGVSVTFVERKAKLANGAICKWNSSVPRVDKLESVANALGVTIDEILRKEIYERTCKS
jgi:transcriptional regulator with XRE-family HTH domain